MKAPFGMKKLLMGSHWDLKGVWRHRRWPSTKGSLRMRPGLERLKTAANASLVGGVLACLIFALWINPISVFSGADQAVTSHAYLQRFDDAELRMADGIDPNESVAQNVSGRADLGTATDSLHAGAQTPATADVVGEQISKLIVSERRERKTVANPVCDLEITSGMEPGAFCQRSLAAGSIVYALGMCADLEFESYVGGTYNAFVHMFDDRFADDEVDENVASQPGAGALGRERFLFSPVPIDYSDPELLSRLQAAFGHPRIDLVKIRCLDGKCGFPSFAWLQNAEAAQLLLTSNEIIAVEELIVFIRPLGYRIVWHSEPPLAVLAVSNYYSWPKPVKPSSVGNGPTGVEATGKNPAQDTTAEAGENSAQDTPGETGENSTQDISVGAVENFPDAVADGDQQSSTEETQNDDTAELSVAQTSRDDSAAASEAASTEEGSDVATGSDQAGASEEESSTQQEASRGNSFLVWGGVTVKESATLGSFPFHLFGGSSEAKTTTEKAEDEPESRSEPLFNAPEARCEPQSYRGEMEHVWSVCSNWLSDESVVYIFGSGVEDIAFGAEMVTRHSGHVYSFDPTMERETFDRVASETLLADDGGGDARARLHFEALGLGNVDGTVKYVEQPDSQPSIHLEVRRLQSLMRRLGHKYVDLVKLHMQIWEAQASLSKALRWLDWMLPQQILLATESSGQEENQTELRAKILDLFRVHGFSPLWTSDDGQRFLLTKEEA